VTDNLLVSGDRVLRGIVMRGLRGVDSFATAPGTQGPVPEPRTDDLILADMSPEQLQRAGALAPGGDHQPTGTSASPWVGRPFTAEMVQEVVGPFLR
jgi:hypothetical protein